MDAPTAPPPSETTPDRASPHDSASPHDGAEPRDGAALRDELDRTVDANRRELIGFCYRMLGSAAEAEDAVQEAHVRAWKALDRFEGRSSLKSWLYRIVNNVCLDMLRSPQRRARPMDLTGSSRAADVVEMPGQLPEHAFVQPIDDDRVIASEGDPAEVAAARESIRLAFVAALQHLPPRQRSVLILCEVLRWQASEAAELLETSTASVNSALQRARATLAELDADSLDPLLDEAHQDLLVRYVDAFERYDVEALVTLLRDDVIMSMPPWNLWLTGPEDVAAWFLGHGIGCKGARLVPIDVNGTAGFASYRTAGPGRWEPFGIQVIEVAGGRIVGHHNFLYPELFEQFGLPAYLEDEAARP